MRYAARFTKTGYIEYISHLDMMRLFERLFKRSGVRLRYSNGFNPHPKISFAAPLSLGYESMGEVVEFETEELYNDVELLRIMNGGTPEGIEITGIRSDLEGKTLASRCLDAGYIIYVPVVNSVADDIDERYLAQDRITALRKKKKTKEPVEVDIKNRLLEFKTSRVDDKSVMTIRCDMRNDSILSPELVIQSFLRFACIDTPRSDIEVVRTDIRFTGFSF